MAHNIDMTNGRANIAYLGSREDVWHRLGQEMKPGQSIEVWAKEAGLDWEAIKVPALANLGGDPRFDHIPAEKRFMPVQDRFHVCRSDSGRPLGYVSGKYQPVQPREVLEWFYRYIAVDDRFQLDVAGSLKQGEIIWATATFRDPLEVAGDRHVARVLMTTTFDGTGSTINQGTMTRTVCNNTLNVSLSDKRAVIRTTHSTKFDAKKVGEELATIAKGFACYKAMGDALAQNEMAKDEVSIFFKTCLDIPLESKESEVSTRKMNQFRAVVDAYKVTSRETKTGTAWAALNAITRYVDHDRSASKSSVYGSEDESRFFSANFQSGATVKAKAVGLLMPRIQDKLLIAA